MATLRSSDARTAYVAGALIFSGRPDPTWAVSADQAKQWINLWNTCEPYRGPLPSPPALGYRGVFLRESAQREWFAYRGVVTLKTPKPSESRRDANREFERLLLASAPQHMIPSQIIDAELTRKGV
jgi:hypothetical protein